MTVEPTTPAPAPTPASALAPSAASPPAPSAPPGYESVNYAPLDPRALRLWQLTDLIAYLVLAVFPAAGGIGIMFNWRWLTPLAVTIWVAYATLAAWTILYYHPRNYRAWGYHVDHRVLLIRQGVWFRSIKLLPLPRLQHVDVKRGPLQRRFGLATLVLHTAGTHAASIEVPGLDAAEAVGLRDHLVAAGGDDGV
jgi:membrane protein YdbS with pleckstrin-like domain